MIDDLWKKDKYLDLLFEHLREGIAVCQMVGEKDKPSDMVFLYTNKAYEELTGLSDCVGKKVTEVIPGLREANPELFEIYGQVAQSGKEQKFESYSKYLGGWRQVTAFSPEIGYFVTVFENINEKKLQEKAKQEAESNYRVLFEGAPYGIVVLDPESAAILDFNDQACRQLGYTREEFSKLKVSDIDAIEKPEETARRMGNVLHTKREDFETKQKTKTGEVRDVAVTAQAAIVSGRIVYHCIWQDITERKKAIMDLQNAYQDAKKMIDIMTGRELRMVQLKQEIERLNRELSEVKGEAAKTS
jgi:PAS domain S-box-containing protein